MTAFTMIDLFYALALGLLVGVVGVAGFNLQHKNSNAAALMALQQQMGPLYNIAWFASSGLSMAAMWLVASLRSAPTLLDVIALIVLIGLAMIASYTLLGNAMKLLGERMSSGS